jgi:hypothetical protein
VPKNTSVIVCRVPATGSRLHALVAAPPPCVPQLVVSLPVFVAILPPASPRADGAHGYYY